MGLLPPAFQDKTEFQPLGKAIKAPEPKKPDPIKEFEKYNHDIPFNPDDYLLTMRAPILYMFGEPSIEYGQIGECDGAIHSSKLSWPMIEGLPEQTFLPEVVNPAPTDEEVEEWKVHRRQRGAMLVSRIDFWLRYDDRIAISPDDMAAVSCFFGSLGLPEKWRGRVIGSASVDNLP